MKLFDVMIYGARYLVEYKVMESQGEAYLERGLIYINPDNDPVTQRIALIHEIAHVVLQRYPYQIKSLEDVSHENDLREDCVIDLLAVPLYDVLAANPHIREWLFYAKKS